MALAHGAKNLHYTSRKINLNGFDKLVQSVTPQMIKTLVCEVESDESIENVLRKIRDNIDFIVYGPALLIVMN